MPNDRIPSQKGHTLSFHWYEVLEQGKLKYDEQNTRTEMAYGGNPMTQKGEEGIFWGEGNVPYLDWWKLHKCKHLSGVVG